jgi:hypothetical protein
MHSGVPSWTSLISNLASKVQGRLCLIKQRRLWQARRSTTPKPHIEGSSPGLLHRAGLVVAGLIHAQTPHRSFEPNFVSSNEAGCGDPSSFTAPRYSRGRVFLASVFTAAWRDGSKRERRRLVEEGQVTCLVEVKKGLNGAVNVRWEGKRRLTFSLVSFASFSFPPSPHFGGVSTNFFEM